MNSPPLILVHGAWHDSRCWALIAEILGDAGAEIHTPDLPGHGKNILPLNRITLECYTKHLELLLQTLAVPAIVVAHSMSGIAVTQLAARKPHLIAEIIYISAYLPLPGESLFDLMALNREDGEATLVEQALRMSADKRSCTIEHESIIPLFYNECPDELARQSAAMFSPQATLPLSSRTRYQSGNLVSIPSSYICCTLDRVLPLQHQRRMIKRFGCKTLLQIEADHSPFYCAPGMLSKMLLATVSQAGS